MHANVSLEINFISIFMDYRVEDGIVVDHKGMPVLNSNRFLSRHPKSLDKVPFNTDWNLLMPVIEKIESMGYIVDITGKAVSIHKPGDDYCIVDLCGFDYPTKISAVFAAVVEFIDIVFLKNKKQNESDSI